MKDKPVGAPRSIFQPMLFTPRQAWLYAAIACIGASAFFLLAPLFHGKLRHSVPVCIALMVAAIAITVFVSLRIQSRSFALIQRPKFVPRLAGAMLRMGCVFPALAMWLYLLGAFGFQFYTPKMVMVTFFAFGGAIAFAGLVRRLGSEQVCAVCGYECQTSSERCSECGNLWRKPDGLIRGRRVTQRGAVAAGVAIVLIGFAGSLPTRFNLVRLGLYLMPDRVRIRVATTGASWSSEGRLEDVLGGSLSLDNEQLLATRLLDQRLENEDLSVTAVAWLEGKVLAGGLTEAIRERFFEERLNLWLEGPDEIIAGEEFRPLIASRSPGPPLGSSLAMQIYLAGVSTDGGRSFVGRNDFVLEAVTVSNVWYYGARRTVQSKSQYLPRVSIHVPGEHEMVVRMWFALVPRTARTYRVKWNADGTPVLPQGAVWTKEVELRRTVTVEKR